MIKISVDEKNIALHTKLAYFLDQGKFVIEVRKIRKLWNINKKFVENFDGWYTSYHPDYSLSKDAATHYLKYKDGLEVESSTNVDTTLEKQLEERKFIEMNPIDLEVELMMKKLGINPKYKRLVSRAIACNEVSEGDIGGESFEYNFVLNDAEFNHIMENTYRGRKSKTEIIRDREIYHLNRGKNKISQRKIGLKFEISRESVKESIKRYRQFLCGGKT